MRYRRSSRSRFLGTKHVVTSVRQLVKITCIAAVLWAGAARNCPAQTLTTLYSFCPHRGCSDGDFPIANLVQGTDGDFYSTAYGGGNPRCGSAGCGTVYKITPGGAFTLLYAFCSQPNCADGYNPSAGLIQASDGNFYGTTALGGNPTCNSGHGCGTVFRITAAGTLTTLHMFAATDGLDPLGELLQANDGNLYGTTSGGGTDYAGTVFRITLSGAFISLHSFDVADGSNPYPGVVQGGDGNLYGTTHNGGDNRNCSAGCGTVFRITPGGALTSLYTFCSEPSCADGYYPYGGLVQAADGNLYGTTTDGGNPVEPSGTIFRITPDGALATLHEFCSLPDCADGAQPLGALVQASDGNFYGTTVNNGGVFEITPSGTFTTLAMFEGANGADPEAGLVQASDGNLYGTTSAGGAYEYGTVFRLVLSRPCLICRP